MTKISIIVPTCNRPTELKRALDSIAKQSFSDYQVLIINNGSKPSEISAYGALEAEYDQRFHFLNFHNDFAVGFGPAMARNIGLQAAKGEYIAFLDDDDLWHDSSYLNILSNKLDKYQPQIIISDQQGLSNHDGKIQCTRTTWFENITNSPNYQQLDENTGLVDFEYFSTAAVFPHLNITVYHKNLLTKLGGFDKSLWYEEDLELFLRAANEVNKITYNNQCIASHYIPQKTLQQNITANVDELKKHSLRLCLANKLQTLTLQPAIKKYVNNMMLYSTKHLAAISKQSNHYENAFIYAKLALACRFSLKWLVFTAHLAFLRLTRK